MFKVEPAIKKADDLREYKDLDTIYHLKVILFVEQTGSTGYFYPATVFGVTNNLDTIAVMDMNFKGKIELKSKVVVGPSKWLERQKEYRTLFIISNRKRQNVTLQNVKVIYRGEFREIKK